MRPLHATDASARSFTGVPMGTAQPEEPAPASIDVAPPPSRRTVLSEPLSRFMAKLAFELLVVFAGVTLAFVAENRRQQIQRANQAREIYAALAAEITDHTTVGQRVLDQYLEQEKTWDASFARGER